MHENSIWYVQIEYVIVTLCNYSKTRKRTIKGQLFFLSQTIPTF